MKIKLNLITNAIPLTAMIIASVIKKAVDYSLQNRLNKAIVFFHSNKDDMSISSLYVWKG